MPDRELPARPNLEQYKKQAKELARDGSAGDAVALARVERHHPRSAESRRNGIALTDAQLVIAREHGFESWPKFAGHITRVNLERAAQALDDPATAFIRAACVPREGSHNSGTLEQAEMILARYP